MAAADPGAHTENVALVELRKEALEPPVQEVACGSVPDKKPGDPDATLPWDQSRHSSMSEVATEPTTPSRKASETEKRPSPEGSRMGLEPGPTGEEEVFPGSSLLREEEEGNRMPEVAAHVFIPIDPHCIEKAPGCRGSAGASDWKKKQQQLEEEAIVCCEKENVNPEKLAFLTHGPLSYPMHYDEPAGYDGGQTKPLSERLPCLQCQDCSSANLKAVASMIGAMIIFPCFVYGAYVFLPFDAPLMPTMSARLVYTLRCGVFGTFPIILGLIVYGVSRLCFSSVQPFGELRREVEIHRRYVSQSVYLFILYFFNIAVLATYLPQEALKLIPLLTGLFAISRLLYWLAYAMGRSFRGFGFGLTFLPLLTMLLWNLYSMFILEPEDMFATAANGKQDTPSEKQSRAAAPKPRYWG
ncbi:Transmembrane protein 79 [Platysternon megacephalum]|uniref:Transmembrane protein 79 n=1 Tax=Platysternon megacephalum TaxID=55544 RepID=A0A4D9E9J8_9SAUR|nr:Transmembrane protein 79 [Platysternon megacephalum]